MPSLSKSNYYVLSTTVLHRSARKNITSSCPQRNKTKNNLSRCLRSVLQMPRCGIKRTQNHFPIPSIAGDVFTSWVHRGRQTSKVKGFFSSPELFRVGSGWLPQEHLWNEQRGCLCRQSKSLKVCKQDGQTAYVISCGFVLLVTLVAYFLMLSSAKQLSL